MHEPQTDPKDIREGKKVRAKSRLQKRWLFFFGTLALFFVTAYCIVNRDRLASFFSSAEGIGSVLSPLFIGCIIAYLLNSRRIFGSQRHWRMLYKIRQN